MQNSLVVQNYIIGSKTRSWIVVFSAALFFFYEFIQINMFNAISPGVMKSFGLTAEQLGNLAATYLYSTVLCLFPIGILLDRFSTKKLILLAMSTCIVCTFLFSISTSLLMAQVFRFIAGGAGAFCFLSSLMLASRWFPLRKLALVTGLIVTVAMLGGVVAQTPLTLLVDHLGWRHALMVTAVLGSIFILIIYIFVEDYPSNFDKKRESQHYALGFWISIKKALGNYQNWFCGLYTSLLNLVILLLGAVWGSSYLETVSHVSRMQASWISTMIFVGTIVGSPVMGWFSDFIGLRKLPMILGALFSLMLVLILIFTHISSFYLLMSIFFLLGFTTSTQILSYPVVAELNPQHLMGASEGIASALIMSGGAVAQPLFGWLMDLNWDGKIRDGVRMYSSHDYHLAMFILPVAFLISLVLAFLIRETHGQRLKH